jgi:hypothetical protein
MNDEDQKDRDMKNLFMRTVEYLMANGEKLPGEFPYNYSGENWYVTLLSNGKYNLRKASPKEMPVRSVQMPMEKNTEVESNSRSNRNDNLGDLY